MDKTTPTQEDFDRARAFVWTTADQRQVRLDTITDKHLKNLLGHLRRRKETLDDRYEDFLLSQLEPKMTSSFSGVEKALSYVEDAQANVGIEIRRRIDSGETVAENLQAGEIAVT